MDSLVSPTFNFLILVALMVYFLREPLSGFVSGRHASVRDEIRKVRDLLQHAQERYDEFNAKLNAIEVETTALREQSRQDAEAAKKRIVGDAQRLSANIIADSRTTAEYLVVQLKRELYEEVGLRVIERAGVLLRERLTGDDRARIRQEFSSQVEHFQ